MASANSFSTQLLATTASALVRHDHQAIPVGVKAHHCGRNQVWRIDLDDGQTYFAKIWGTRLEFERDRFGLQLAEAVAHSNPKLNCARVVFEKPEDGLLVTTALPGTPVAQLIRDAYRLDKWIQRDIARDAVRRSMALLL